MPASSLPTSFPQYTQQITHPRTETASLITSKHGNQSLSEAFTPRHLQSRGIGQGFNKGNSCRARIWWITFTYHSQKGSLQTHHVTNHLALQRSCDEWGRKQQRAGGPAPQASEGQHHRLLDCGLPQPVTLYALVRGQQMPEFWSMGCAKGVVLLGS